MQKKKKRFNWDHTQMSQMPKPTQWKCNCEGWIQRVTRVGTCPPSNERIIIKKIIYIYIIRILLSIPTPKKTQIIERKNPKKYTQLANKITTTVSSAQIKIIKNSELVILMFIFRINYTETPIVLAKLDSTYPSFEN